MGEFSPSKLAQNTLKFTLKISPIKSNNRMSFWALLICVFIYISIFNYLFKLSPRVLFNTTKFWFLISNTLIIIIAADSGAFSSSKYNIKTDPCDQFSVTPHYNFRAIEPPNKYNIGAVQEKGKTHTPNDPQKCITIVNEAKESKEKPWEVAVQECTLSSNQDDALYEDKEMIEVRYDHKEEINDQAKSCQLASKSEDDKNETKVNDDEENDKFSSMSDEELNKRVEEFIRRFYNEQLQPQVRRRLVDE